MMASSKQGFTLGIAAMFGVILVTLITLVSKSVFHTSKEMTFYENLNRTRQVAESGLNKGIGMLIASPNAYTTSEFTQTYTDAAENAQYNNEAQQITTGTLLRGFYFVVTSATRTVNGKIYTTKLESYLQLANPGDYAVAVSGTLVIARGSNLTGGKVYGKSVEFIDQTAAFTTSALTVDYVEDPVTPDVASPLYKSNNPAGWIDISYPANGLPRKLDAPLILPQLNSTTLNRYKEIAHLTGGGTPHNQCTFSGDIFPPGYNTPKDVLDTYPSHTADNNDHVYYCPPDAGGVPQDIRITNGVVYGQVLFVTEGDIYIEGSLKKAATGITPPGTGTMASTAHQAVLITPRSVYITNNYTAVPTAVPQRLDVFIIAPHGRLQPVAYNGAAGEAIMNSLLLHFNGSIIASETPDMANVFRAFRGYTYDTTLSTNPPPYLPYIAQLVYIHERSTSPAGVYK